MITVLALSPAVDKIYYIDGFEAGNLYRVGNVLKSAGGKGINVARVASILGQHVTAAGFKAGETGNWLESKLKEIGVCTCFIEVEGESRTNSNIIDRINGKETELLETGPEILPDKREDFISLFQSLLPRTSVLVCSGGLPAGITPDFYRKLIEMAKAYNIKTILDTSNDILVEGVKAKPYLIKPNLRELGKYSGRKLGDLDDIVRVCREIISEGVEVVVASMGSEGAVLVSGNTVLLAKAPEIEIINTIGSGDSMVAGFAAAISGERPMDEILKLGMACAVTNTQYAEIGMIDMDKVSRLYNDINVTNINA